MSKNKTLPTQVDVATFLETVSEQRKTDSQTLITMMEKISGESPVMWGPSIIGFGTCHYRYETGREGDMPLIGFSPRKANLTIYVSNGFHKVGTLLDKLGPHKASVSCLYVSKLSDVDLNILKKIIKHSYIYNKNRNKEDKPGWKSVDDYLASLRGEQKKRVEIIRRIAHEIIPEPEDVISYQVPTVRYKGNNVVHYAAYVDHIGVYPVPKDMDDVLKPYIRGKGTLWFSITDELPLNLIREVVQALYQARLKR